MVIRWAMVAAFAGVLTAQTPPPMFSPWYGEALRDILRLEASDVKQLEAQLATNPDDFVTRLKLMAYHQRADRAGNLADVAKRVQHSLWLIEHHPDSEILHSYVSKFSKGQLTTEEFERASQLWLIAAKTRPFDAAVHWNAASFFEDLDSRLHLQYLETTAAADPNHPFALRPLAHIYALAVLGRGPLSARAQAALDASTNVWVLGNAAYMLQSQYNQSLRTGNPNRRAAELAEKYFLRAKALNLGLDRKAILPALPATPQPATSTTPVKAPIRRLPIDSFPHLPATVASVLRAHRCSIPQPGPDARPANVIRGEFFAKGQAGWAVLCSVDRRTSLLAFRNDEDRTPQVLHTSDDDAYLVVLNRQGFYSREIRAVGRDFIIGHYRAYGGPEPPPITHHGIDDAFLEKASITWYFNGGKWLKLQGAD